MTALERNLNKLW